MESKVRWLPSNSSSAETPTKIPSLFGQLVSLASRCSQSGVDVALREARKEAFASWLCLDLEQQRASLEGYAEWLGTDLRAVLGQLLESDAHRLAPADATETERHLFVADLKALLEILQNEYDGSFQVRNQ